MLEANDPTELPLSPSRNRHAREQLLSPVREDQRLDEPLGSQPVQAVHEPARLEAKSMPREVFAELCDGDRAMPANQHLENPQRRVLERHVALLMAPHHHGHYGTKFSTLIQIVERRSNRRPALSRGHEPEPDAA